VHAPGAGHVSALSHVSPLSTIELPQAAARQSASSLVAQSAGQQPSEFGKQAVMGMVVHAALQASAMPVNATVRHGSVFGHSVGQGISGGSQVSRSSNTPFPQLAGLQSESVCGLQTLGQQPSSLMHSSVKVVSHFASQVATDPL